MSELSRRERNHRPGDSRWEERSRGKVKQPKGQFKDLFQGGSGKSKSGANSQPSKTSASSQKR